MLHLPRLRITRPYCTSVALEEERVWVAFYRRVGNPDIAAEVIQHLDADADQKRAHPALYLRCKESLRRKKARQARTKRIRSFMRRILGGLLDKHSISGGFRLDACGADLTAMLMGSGDVERRHSRSLLIDHK